VVAAIEVIELIYL